MAVNHLKGFSHLSQITDVFSNVLPCSLSPQTPLHNGFILVAFHQCAWDRGNTSPVVEKMIYRICMVLHVLHWGKNNKCNQSFAQLGGLNYHILAHTGGKPHVRSHCGKGFAVKGHMIRFILACVKLHKCFFLYKWKFIVLLIQVQINSYGNAMSVAKV